MKAEDQSARKKLKKSCLLLSVGALTLLSFSVHLCPLAFSNYPFNQDSLFEATVARDIIESGSIALPWQQDSAATHSESTPVYNVLIAFVASSLGVDPMYVIQWIVAILSVLLVLTTFVLLLSIAVDVRAALAGSFFVCLFGTMVYVTSSGWKITLGLSLWLLLMYAYSWRHQTGMKLLAVVLLLVLPFVHHLAAIVSYMAVAFLVVWNWVYAIVRGKTTKRHFEELFVFLAVSVIALVYYYEVSFDRLEYIESLEGLLFFGVTMLLAFLVVMAALLKKTHVRVTFAFLPAGFILLISILDYNGVFFRYTPSTSFFNYFLIACASAFMIFLGWFGIEHIIESKSRFRAIPLAMLLPPVVVILFGLVSPSVENKHQLVYRTFDLADPAMGIGIGLAFSCMPRRPELRKAVPGVMSVFLALLLVTLPYGLYTEEFTGVRHETQAYEIEMVDWLMTRNPAIRYDICTDMRLAYVVWALYGQGMNNSLPSMLMRNNSLSPAVFYVYENFWSTSGVNDYPNGIAKIPPEYISRLMEVSAVIYIAGPLDNRAVVITKSWIGESQHNWNPAQP